MEDTLGIRWERGQFWRHTCKFDGLESTVGDVLASMGV